MMIGKYNSKFIFDKLNTIISNYNDILQEEKINVLYENQNNLDINSKLIKMYLNYYIKKEHRTNIINELFDSLFNTINKDDLIKNFYLTRDEIIILYNNSMIIGNHTTDHLVLSQLNYKEQYEQIHLTNIFISTLINKKIDSFCYPYGGSHVYNNTTIQILKELDFSFAVDVLFSDRSNLNLLNNKYAIYRFDCNHFPYGQIYNYNL